MDAHRPDDPAEQRHHASLRLRIRTGRLPRTGRGETDRQRAGREPDELAWPIEDDEPPGGTDSTPKPG